MTGMWRARGRRRVAAMARRVLFLWACIPAGAVAQTAAPSGWSVVAGVGVASTPVYRGSSEQYVVPFPSVQASYSLGTLSVSASALNGFGLTYLQSSTGLVWSLSMTPGERRVRDGYSVMGIRMDHPDDVRALLENSADVHTRVSTVARVLVPTPVGLVGASVGYTPTRVTHAAADVRERTRHGARYALLYGVQLPVADGLTVAGSAQVTAMSGAHAAAWYGVEHATTSVPVFSAGAGLEDTQASLQVDYRLSETLHLSVMGAHTWLLGDARRSPYTQAARSRTVVIQLLKRL